MERVIGFEFEVVGYPNKMTPLCTSTVRWVQLWGNGQPWGNEKLAEFQRAGIVIRPEAVERLCGVLLRSVQGVVESRHQLTEYLPEDHMLVAARRRANKGEREGDRLIEVCPRMVRACRPIYGVSVSPAPGNDEFEGDGSENRER